MYLYQVTIQVLGDTSSYFTETYFSEHEVEFYCSTDNKRISVYDVQVTSIHSEVQYASLQTLMPQCEIHSTSYDIAGEV